MPMPKLINSSKMPGIRWANNLVLCSPSMMAVTAIIDGYLQEGRWDILSDLLAYTHQDCGGAVWLNDVQNGCFYPLR